MIANPIGLIIDKFVHFADDDSGSRVLPMAATLERQRVELLDEYERQLMLRQMRNTFRNQQMVCHRILYLTDLEMT